MSSRDAGRRSAAKDSALSRRNILLGGTTIAAASALAAPGSVTTAQAQPQAPVTAAGRRPNILVIFGDDVGLTNVSAYSLGLMGYRTPNIDRIAKEGMMFTDYYAEQSCTAGRSSFITGQATLRTGLSKVGLPAANLGLRFEDITIAEALKPLGYATGQFGKNHLGDRNEFLPTVHGFDEFFGNLYHLNAEEEPEHPDYPKDPRFRARYGPRGVLKCAATTTDDATVDPRFGKVGRQKIEDTGPLTKKRMETIDDETCNAAVDFIQRQTRANKPFFVWWNGTRMHLYTHVRPENRRQERRQRVFRRHAGARRPCRPAAEGARRSRHRQRHHRRLLNRQRPAHELVARRRHDAVPWREEHQLGRRVPRAGDGALARPGPRRRGLERDRLCARLVPDAGGGGRRQRREGPAAQGLGRRRAHLQGAPRRLQPAALHDRAARTSRHARSSSTSTTTANSWRSATRT